MQEDLYMLFCASRECTSKVLKTLVDEYRTTLYSYNTMIKKYGVYLKPIHIVVKKTSEGAKVYHYYGKYWYKVVYSNGRLRWVYIGREKPFPWIPNPPLNPITTVKIINRGSDTSCIYVDKINLLEKITQYVKEAIIKVGCVNSISENST
ncbi:MAG: hypothetical protein QW775_05800 [Ignisphaera sp.]